MLRNFKLTVGRKIFGSVLIVILLFVVNAYIIQKTSTEIGKKVTFSTQIVRPSSEALNKFHSLVSRSKMLITNWVYLPDNIRDKGELKLIHNTEYPSLKNEILELSANWESDTLKSQINQAILNMDKILETQKDQVMLALVTFDDYQDPMIRFSVDDVLESIIVPGTDRLLKEIGEITKQYNLIRETYDADMGNAMDSLSNITVLLTSISIIIAFISVYFLIRNITLPINEVKHVIETLSKGDIGINENLNTGNDEIGEMRNSVLHLVKGLKGTSAFAESIGNGDYDAKFTPLSEKDVLGNALMDMRTNLAKVADQERIRGWVNEGLAKFADLLRNNSEDIDHLADTIMSNLINYLNVNQGALYIVESDTDSENEDYIYMASCYAWDKEKSIDQKILKGEGLAGQVWQEGLSVYMSDVPDSYIKITSGLGEANPRFVFVSPIKINDEIQGVIEIASFTEIEQYKRNFIEKLGESIASTLFNVRNSMKTKHLLEESQMMTEYMKSQEEEMRQNMEEIQATQEEMERNHTESNRMIDAVDKTVAKVDINSEGRINTANENFLSHLGYRFNEVDGETFRMFFGSENATENYKKFWKELQSGEQLMGEFEFLSKGGNSIRFKGGFVPFFDSNDVLIKVQFYGIEITTLEVYS